MELNKPRPTIADLSNMLIIRILGSTNEYMKLMSFGFKVSMLEGKIQFVASFIMSHFAKHECLPTIQLVTRMFPGVLKMVEAPEAATFYWTEILKLRKEVSLVNILSDLRNWDTSDVTSVIDRLICEVSKVKNDYVEDDSEKPESLTTLIPKSLGSYGKREEHADSGIPIPFESLRAAYRFWGGGKLQSVIARTGVGKTWYVCMCALAAIVAGFKVLFISLEMPKNEITDRLICLHSGVSYERYIHGELSSEEKALCEEKNMELVEAGNAELLVILGEQTSPPEMLQSFITSLKPKLIVIDAFYRQNNVPGKDQYEKITYMIREYKRIALRNDVHIMTTSQFNRSARGKSSANEFAVAFSDAINHESDYVLRLVQNNDAKKTNQVDITMGKVRSGRPNVGARYNWDFDLMKFDMIGGINPFGDDDDTSAVS